MELSWPPRASLRRSLRCASRRRMLRLTAIRSQVTFKITLASDAAQPYKMCVPRCLDAALTYRMTIIIASCSRFDAHQHNWQPSNNTTFSFTHSVAHIL